MVEGLLRRRIRCSALLIILSVSISGCIGHTSSQVEQTQEKLVFYQLEPMREGEEIAVVSTTEGDIYLRFFPSEAPKAVSNFITLAQEGFYDGKSVFSIQKVTDSEGNEKDAAFLAGAANETGSRGKTIYRTGAFRSELSENLWHFPGAVSAYGSGIGKVDSRFFIVGNQEIDEATASRMKKANFPDEVIKRFREQGGAPSYSRLYPVFAQVYQGMDVVEKILEAECDEKGVPVEEISIVSVTIGYYDPEEQGEGMP